MTSNHWLHWYDWGGLFFRIIMVCLFVFVFYAMNLFQYWDFFSMVNVNEMIVYSSMCLLFFFYFSFMYLFIYLLTFSNDVKMFWVTHHNTILTELRIWRKKLFLAQTSKLLSVFMIYFLKSCLTQIGRG